MNIADIASRFFHVGLDATIKSGMILALAATLTWLARSTSAATRHRVWSLALTSCLLMPLVCLVLPQIQIPILPANPPLVSSMPVQFAGPPAAAANGSQLDRPLYVEPIRFDATSSAPKRLEVTQRNSPALTVDRGASMSAISLPVLVLAGWSVGALAIWSLLIGAVVRIQRRVRRSTPAPTSWLQSLGDVTGVIRFATSVRVLWDRDSTIPLAAGVVHPVILMPTEAGKWSLASRRYALLHEFAHIERRDVLWQLLGQFTLGLYWFNPLVWFAIRRLRIEREWACDDRVVQLTGRASDYATQLVEIARSARSLSLMVPAVAMAQASDLEHRLTMMFDRARSHLPLSGRTARRLTIAVTIMSLALAAIQPVARVFEGETKAQAVTNQSVPVAKEKSAPASNQEPKQPSKQDPAGAVPGRTTMQVKVVDQAGKPIVGAKIHASIWDVDRTKRGDIPNRDYKTDENGIASVERPVELRILRLWASHPDFVCLFGHWEDGEHDNGRLLPKEFTFTLPTGIAIGGQVVDEAGKPIEGVRVEATLQDNSPLSKDQRNVVFNRWLAIGDDSAVSDREGRWIVKNVPASFDREAINRVSLQFNHPDYLPIPSNRSGEAQPSYATDALRAQTLPVSLKKGIRLEGIVRDPAGKPVAKALVIRGDDPYFEWGSQEELTDAEGRYRLPALPAEKLTMTVVAQGWMPQMREVDLGRESNADFHLEPGQPLKLKIVDQSGKPVSKCYVSVREWRGKKSLYTHRHPDVINSEIPNRADEQGNYVWEWSPADAVKYQIGTPGYVYQEIELIAGDAEQTITLKPDAKIFGSVTDAATGKPVPKFAVYPTLIFRKDFYGQDNDDATVGTDGQYSVKLDRTDVSYCLVIEADGYRAAIGESFHITSGEHREDFKLEPASLLKGRVVDSQGRPVKGAQVHLATNIRSLQYDSDDHFMGRPPLVTSDDGRFQFVPQRGPYKLVAIHEQGYYRAELAAEAQPGDITLLPWARVEGTLYQEGRPVPNATIFVHVPVERASDQLVLRESRQVKTNAAGHFAFPKVPPGRIVIRPHLSVWQEHPITSSRYVPLDLKPGETVHVDLGGRGAQVAGRVVLKGDVPPDFDLNYSLNYLVRRESALPPPKDLAHLAKIAEQGLTESLLRSDEGERYLELHERHFVRLGADGRFLVNGVSAGEYDFAVSIYDRPQGCLIDPIAMRIIPVAISNADVDRGTVSLPDIDLSFPERAKVGDPLPEIAIRLPNGEAMSFAKLKGKPLLLHGWATWCEPCVKALPKLKSLRASFSAEELAIVGLNLDETTADASEFAAKEKLSWEHVYVGAKSEAARRLGLSSVPYYLVVSRDGKLLAKTTEWDSAEVVLKKLLSK